MTPTDIRDYIIRTIEVRGITQSELAVRSGVEQANISRYLNSEPKDNVVSSTALRLLDALEIELTVKPKSE